MSDDASTEQPYIGRFAPSPTGPLHFGSLIAAVASYLQARVHDGEWLVRIEDIDPPREISGATDAILNSLEAHGFPIGTPLYQSTRLKIYDSIIEQLLDTGAAYHCSCSRKEIHSIAPEGLAGPIYPGRCRHGADTSNRPAISVRMRTTDAAVCFEDALQGSQRCLLESCIGDFLIRRGDGLVAYQLAVVVDDAAQQISEVVRGTDLLESTFMQLHLQRALGYKQLKYMHFPVAIGADNKKLSKQTGAPPVNDKQPAENLYKALEFLGQSPEKPLKTAQLKDIWNWAQENWEPLLLQGAQKRLDGSMMVQ
jgi:glutamyl-Q tRNA(Asp) synthetase